MPMTMMQPLYWPNIFVKAAPGSGVRFPCPPTLAFLTTSSSWLSSGFWPAHLNNRLPAEPATGSALLRGRSSTRVVSNWYHFCCCWVPTPSFGPFWFHLLRLVGVVAISLGLVVTVVPDNQRPRRAESLLSRWLIIAVVAGLIAFVSQYASIYQDHPWSMLDLR